MRRFNKIQAMIDREQVLHVARLARLKLSDQEVEAMSRELSSILDHIEKISELELDGVEPTSHVVDLQNAFREDVPEPSLAKKEALAVAPDVSGDGLFKVPSPGASEE